MTTTDDFKALRRDWQETILQPTADPLTGALRRARESYEHLLEVRERMKFGAWVQTLRERQEFLEEEATLDWVGAVVSSGVATFPKGGRG